MAKFWCWFLGHKYCEYSEHFQRNATPSWVHYCSRCGERFNNVIRN